MRDDPADLGLRGGGAGEEEVDEGAGAVVEVLHHGRDVGIL